MGDTNRLAEASKIAACLCLSEARAGWASTMQLWCSARAFDYLLNRHKRGRMMSNFQAVVLGMVVAWTPSLIALAYLLIRAPLIESDEESTKHAER